MNVSMMDSYNLAWKLIYSIHGLTPGPLKTAKQDPVLDTYHLERHTIAQQLIDFDRAFSSMFSGKISSEDGKQALTHEQFLEVFSTGNGFTSGCGIEYPENITVEKSLATNPIKGTDYLHGILRPGRRLLNVRVRRFADGNRRDLQDGILSFHSPQNIHIQQANNTTRLPLNRPLPHPHPNLLRPPQPHRNIRSNPHIPLLTHLPISCLSN
jgi:hypothetical protein